MMMLVNGSVGKEIIARELHMMGMGMLSSISCSLQMSNPTLMSCNLPCGIDFIGPAIETLYKLVGKFSLYRMHEG